MLHSFVSLKRPDWGWSAAILQSVPIVEQLLTMQLNPGFHQPPLTNRDFAGQQLDWIDSKHRHVFLIIGMKMRQVMTL
jgi:hypothetical protein